MIEVFVVHSKCRTCRIWTRVSFHEFWKSTIVFTKWWISSELRRLEIDQTNRALVIWVKTTQPRKIKEFDCTLRRKQRFERNCLVCLNTWLKKSISYESGRSWSYQTDVECLKSYHHFWLWTLYHHIDWHWSKTLMSCVNMPFSKISQNNPTNFPLPMVFTTSCLAKVCSR